MTQAHGNSVILHFFPSGAASANLTGDLNSVAMRWDKNNPDVTTFSGTTLERISGLRDYAVDYAGIFNTGTGNVEAVMTTEMNASTNTLFVLAPGGSISGSPTYSGCALLSNLTVNGPLNGPVAISFTLQAATGSLTRGTVA